MVNTKSSISILFLGIAITLFSLVSCSGSPGGGTIGGGITLRGLATVGTPIAGGIVSVICSSGSTAATVTTSSSGEWSATLTGQTLPCAVQVSVGSINGAANAAVYHSVVVSPGTATNITPLTDLLVANLVGNSNLSNWFTGLSAGSLSAITQTQVNASLTQLSTALSGLTQLSSYNPITSTLSPSSTSNNMLIALGNALSSTNTSYSTLLNSASSPIITAPTSLNSAITAAYTNIVSCSSTGNTSAISLSVIPSVAGGVAPLAVFFDTTATTATATTRPFHDLQYTWNFGDPASAATWAYGSNAGNNSKNEATGPVAAHVFETPNTTPYTVTVTATDGTNTVTNTCTLITANDPNVIFANTNTICVAASSASQNASSSYCPSGASSVVQSDFATAINTYALSGKRVLFNRGDTFNVGTTNAAITHNGPGIIGAYGPFTLANPLVVSAQKAPLLVLSSASTPGIADWRIMDLEFNGSNAGANNTGISAGGTVNQVLILRMNIHNTYGGVLFGADILDYWNSSGHLGHTMFDQLSIVDTSITTQTGGLCMTGVFIEANRYAMLGTLIDDTTGIEHVSRYPYLNKAIISNNTLSRPSGTKHVIKLHAPVWCQISSGQAYYQPVCNYATDTKPTTGVENTVNGTSYTQFVVISDNKLVPASCVSITVNIGPFSSFADNRLKDIIFERNWMTGADASLQYAVIIDGVSEVTARNNILDMSGASPFRIFFETTGGLSVPFADNIRLYNNTAYASDPSSTSSPVFFENSVSATTNLSVINNLMYLPLAPRAVIVYGTAGTGYVASNNTTSSTAGINATPTFTNPTPLVPSDFRPSTVSYSYAIGTGTIVPVWSDFFQMIEPATRDMGAIIH